MDPNKKNGRRGRPPLLNEAKRRAVCAMLACGGTRTMAAAFVDCSVDTIARTAQRDAEFAAQIRRADVQSILRELRLYAEEDVGETGRRPPRLQSSRHAPACRSAVGQATARRSVPATLRFGPLTAILAKMAGGKLFDAK